MSRNCIRCVKNHRTGPDLLCDDCRARGSFAAPSGSPATPHCCPVCNGAGTVSRPPWIAGDQETWVAGEVGAYPCRACAGKGVIWETERDRSDPDLSVAGQLAAFKTIVNNLPEND